MKSLKRRVAETRIKLRNRQRRKEEKEIERLQKKRNKDLKKAEQYLAKAKAGENAKDAALKKSQAKARLNATKNRRGKAILSSLSRGSKVLLKDLKGRIEQKPARRKRKSVKKRQKR